MNPVQVGLDTASFTQERRQSPRVKVAAQAELRLEGSAPIRVETADLSAGGCYVEMMFTLPVGKELEIVLWIGQARVSARATVVTSHPQFGNGFQFTEILADDRDLLETFLEDQAP
jgi:c-di-GMP-binding flagellar brake protein YcgR